MLEDQNATSNVPLTILLAPGGAVEAITRSTRPTTAVALIAVIVTVPLPSVRKAMYPVAVEPDRIDMVPRPRAVTGPLTLKTPTCAGAEKVTFDPLAAVPPTATVSIPGLDRTALTCAVARRSPWRSPAS